IAEGGEELAEEKWRKSARGHQGREHCSPAVRLPVRPAPAYPYSVNGGARVGDAIAQRSYLCNDLIGLPQLEVGKERDNEAQGSGGDRDRGRAQYRRGDCKTVRRRGRQGRHRRSRQ